MRHGSFEVKPSSPPTRRGTTSSGSTSNLLAENAEGTLLRLIRSPGVAANSLLHTVCNQRHTSVNFALLRSGVTGFTTSERICRESFSCLQLHSAPETQLSSLEQPLFLSSPCDQLICSGSLFIHWIMRRTSGERPACRCLFSVAPATDQSIILICSLFVLWLRFSVFVLFLFRQHLAARTFFSVSPVAHL